LVEHSTEPRIDTLSFQLGMINCFVEMVACGVKRMAISPPLTPDEYARIESASSKIVGAFGMLSHLEKSLLLTDLQTEEFTKGKWSVLYYRDRETLDAYFALKERKNKLEELGQYGELERKDVSRAFMRLLSYPDKVIDAKLSQTEPTNPFVLSENREES